MFAFQMRRDMVSTITMLHDKNVLLRGEKSICHILHHHHIHHHHHHHHRGIGN
jgi:hypothetical protein